MREYVPAALGLSMEAAGTHRIVGWEDFCGQFPRTAIVEPVESEQQGKPEGGK